MPREGSLKPEGPFSLPLTLLCGQAFRWRREDDGKDASVAFLGVAGGAAWRLRQGNGVVRWTCGTDLVRGEPAGRWLSRYLGLENSVGTTQAFGVQSGGLLGEALEALKGLRLIRQEPFECAVSYMFAQGLSVTVISRAVEKLCAGFGAPLPPPPGSTEKIFWDFPGPGVLARLRPERIRPFVNNYHARGERILRLAAAVDSGALDLERLRLVPLADARGALRALEGIGPKIADCVLLFSLDHPSAFPLDRWVLRALKRHGSFQSALRGVREPPTEGQYDRLCAEARGIFGEHCGWAGEYLFLYLRIRQDGVLRERLGLHSQQSPSSSRGEVRG